LLTNPILGLLQPPNEKRGFRSASFFKHINRSEERCEALLVIDPALSAVLGARLVDDLAAAAALRAGDDLPRARRSSRAITLRPLPPQAGQGRGLLPAAAPVPRQSGQATGTSPLERA
jgi:hypothetical protein